MIRKAEAADSLTLLTLIAALADYEQLDLPTQEAQERFLSHGWPPDGETPRFTAWLAEIEEEGVTKAVGYAITFDTYSSFLARPTLYLEDLFFLPEYRRRGLGSALFQRLIQDATERGCGRMEWVVLDWNTTAQDFYKKHGAKHLDDWHHYRLEIKGRGKREEGRDSDA